MLDSGARICTKYDVIFVKYFLNRVSKRTSFTRQLNFKNSISNDFLYLYSILGKFIFQSFRLNLTIRFFLFLPKIFIQLSV